MNTDMRVSVSAPHAAEGALARAEERVQAIEARFSRFRDTSELCELNRRAGERTPVSPEMREVLSLALELHRETEGVFDPAILPALERAGYDRTFDEIDETARPRPAQRHVRFEAIELDEDAVRLPYGMRLDLGGIVKGWTADQIADDLARLGPALVDLGGDVALRGSDDGRAWRVGVERPGHPDEHLTVLAVAGGGVATSGTARRRWRAAGREMHHLIDPRTDAPARSGLVQVTALHESTARAEVYAKAALVLGIEAAPSLLLRVPGLELLLVPDGGAPVASAGVLAAQRRASDGVAAA